MQFRKTYTLAVSLAIALILIVNAPNPGRIAAWAQTSVEIEASIPESLTPCLPRNAERIELLGMIEQGQETFYLLGVFSGSQYGEPLVMRDSSGCLLVRSQYNVEPLSAYIPLEAAQQLSFQVYQRRIQEAGGLQAFQQGLTEYLSQPNSTEISYFSPEDLWAMEQLGVELPDGTYRVLEPDTQPDLKAPLP
ncbi:MAG: hypothetical protein MJA27_36455 [Pseudanabaenales cyanobacterium]|nr:hypothetical protein [Pseudanabaenales cyanobacterium]